MCDIRDSEDTISADHRKSHHVLKQEMTTQKRRVQDTKINIFKDILIKSTQSVM